MKYLKRRERSRQQEQRLGRFRSVVQPEQRLHERRPKPPDRAQVTLVEHVQVDAAETVCCEPLLHVGVQLRRSALVTDNGLTIYKISKKIIFTYRTNRRQNPL